MYRVRKEMRMNNGDGSVMLDVFCDNKRGTPVQAVEFFIYEARSKGMSIPDVGIFDVIHSFSGEITRVGKLFDNISVQHSSPLEAV